MPLATSIEVHRIAGLVASVLSLTASLTLALAPDGWSGHSLRQVMVGLAVLLGLGSSLSALVSAGAVLVVVATAPSSSGVAGRFGVAVLAAVGAGLVFVADEVRQRAEGDGSSRWEGPGVEAVLAIVILALVALIAMVQVWTCLARSTGNHQLAEDLRNAYIAAVAGAVLSSLVSLSGLAFITIMGGLASIPGTVMCFRTLGALSRQLRYGAAWAT
jgi:hypothetical protein